MIFVAEERKVEAIHRSLPFGAGSFVVKPSSSFEINRGHHNLTSFDTCNLLQQVRDETFVVLGLLLGQLGMFENTF